MRNFTKNKNGISPIMGVILMVAITVLLAAVVTVFVFGLGNPETNTKAVKEKNPNIEYFGNGTIRLSGNNSAELAANLAKFNWMNSCRMNEGQPFSIIAENNKLYVLLAINNGCATNFR